MPSKNPEIIRKHNKRYYATHRKQIDERGYVKLDGRDKISIIVGMALYMYQARNWVSTEELMREFDIGHKQVTRYMKRIEPALPMIVDKGGPANPDSRGGHMNYYKVIR